MEVKSKVTQERIPLEDYPVKDSTEPYYLKKLDAHTIYYFLNDERTEGRWMATLLIDTKYGKSGRIYKWQWRRPKKAAADNKWVPDDSKPYRWFLDEKVNINKLRYWEQIRDFFEDVF